MTFGEVIISAAIEAAKEEPSKPAAAAKLLVAKCKSLGLNPPKNPINFVRRWQGRVTPQGKIQYRAHKAGRKSQLTAAQVEAAYKAIINWEAAGRSRPYNSAHEIENDCGPVKKLLAKTGVRVDTLIHRIKAVHPRFGREKLGARWALSEENQQERLAVALELSNTDHSELQKVVHLDAKTVHMVEEAIYGYVDLGVGYTVAGIKPARKGGKVIKLKYYAAVNAKLGAFFIRFYTGTTDMPATRDGLNYKVSSAAKQLWFVACFHIGQSMFQLSFPFCSTLAGVTAPPFHPQPQHTPPLPHCCICIATVLELPVCDAIISVVALCHQLAAVTLSLHFHQQTHRL